VVSIDPLGFQYEYMNHKRYNGKNRVTYMCHHASLMSTVAAKAPNSICQANPLSMVQVH
jgi:hypothetical protein